MRAVECSAFLVRAIAMKLVNASKPPAAIRQYASTICLSQLKGFRRRKGALPVIE
jgi:hypothetical protein